jgi:hypothetical protein
MSFENKDKLISKVIWNMAVDKYLSPVGKLSSEWCAEMDIKQHTFNASLMLMYFQMISQVNILKNVLF